MTLTQESEGWNKALGTLRNCFLSLGGAVPGASQDMQSVTDVPKALGEACLCRAAYRVVGVLRRFLLSYTELAHLVMGWNTARAGS